jgi:hypothetical protein
MTIKSFDDIARAIENLTDDQRQEMLRNMQKSLDKLHSAQEVREAEQRRYRTACSCPNFCFFHTQYNI